MQVSPRKKSAKVEGHGWWVRLPRWVSFGATRSQPLANTLQMEGIEDLPHSPNNDIPSEVTTCNCEIQGIYVPQVEEK